MMKSQTERKVLPAVKPPHRKTQLIKKTRQTKENNIEDEDVEEVNMKQKQKDQNNLQRYLEQEKVTPLLSNRPDDGCLSEFSKTKKCRVSKML